MTFRREVLAEGVELFMTGAEPDEVWPLVRDYHYSARMPANIQHCYALRRPGGLFGDYGEVVAAAVFSIPPTRWSEEVLELTRLVRHPQCREPISRLIAFGCERLRKHDWPLLVSFADWAQGHHGGVYQAAGWFYDSQRERRMDGLIVDGEFKPGRSCNSTWGTRSPRLLSERFPDRQIEPHFDEGKHLYWRALTVAGKTRAKRLGLKRAPYPKPNNAACLADERPPRRPSQEHTLEAAPGYDRPPVPKQEGLAL
jgi:hypothetical protein